MATIISIRKLQPNDFQSWGARFTAAAAAREKAGCRGLRRFRNLDDADEVIVVFDWDSHANARRFIEGNVPLLQDRDPGTPTPMIRTLYVEELESLVS